MHGGKEENNGSRYGEKGTCKSEERDIEEAHVPALRCLWRPQHA